MNDTILLRRDGPVATLTLNRPDALNALDHAMIEALVARTTEVAGDDSVRVVVLRGAGKHFMAGGDIRTFAGELAERRRGAAAQLPADDRTRLHVAIEQLHRMPHPVVCGVHGAVAGFGLSLMNACDLVVAADDAYFASAYRHIALTPDGGGSWSLPRIVGLRKAMEIFLLGERFDAAEAARLGLVNRSFPLPELERRDRRHRALARHGAACIALRNAKRLVRDSLARTLSEQLEAEAVSFGSVHGDPGFRGGHHRVPRQAPAAVRSRVTKLRGYVANRRTAGARRWQVSRARPCSFRGGSRGIGLAIALRAARDGANVAIAAKTSEPNPKLPGTIHSAAAEIEQAGAAAGAKALPIVCDIRDEAAVQAAVDATVKAFGGIDILVNNASAISLTGTLATPMKRFDLMFAVNVRGTFLCSQACLPHLKRAAAAGRNPHILTLSPPLNLDPRWFKRPRRLHDREIRDEHVHAGHGRGIPRRRHRRQRAVAAHRHRHGGDRDDPGCAETKSRECASRRSWPTPRTRSSSATPERRPAISSSTTTCCARPASTDLTPYAMKPGARLLPDLFLD